MFGCNEKFHFPEIHFLLTNIYSFDPEIILHSYFQFKSFSEKKRERERGRRESRCDRPMSEKKQNGDQRAARSSDERARRSRRESDDRTDLASDLVKGRAISSSPLLHRSSPPISPAPIWWIFLLGFAFSVNECGIDSLLHVYSWGSVWKIGHVKHFL